MHEHDASAYAQAMPEHDAPAHATDGRTDVLTEMHSSKDEISSIASPASDEDEYLDPYSLEHNHSPHVYVIYWPEIATVKVGITTTQERWEWWTRRGAVLIAATDTCCESHARTIERTMLGFLAKYGAKAFASEESARFALGKRRGGYTECYRLVQSPRMGRTPEHPYDYESAYGLILPVEFDAALTRFDFARFEVDPAWEAVS